MKVPDRWISSVLFILSVLLCFQSYRLKIGSYKMPGSGFLPFWVGVVIGFLSLLLFLQSFKREQKEQIENIQTKKRWKNILLVLASIFIYTSILETIGFVISTFIFIVFILKFVESKKWSLVLTIAIASALGTYLIFEVWLQTQLPRGIF